MLLKKFFKFVIPSIVSMWIFALYTMVDGMFVAWGVGERALASVNLSMPYVICIFSIGLLMATGTSTLISIALGQKKEEEASSLFSMNLVVLTIVSLVVTVSVSGASRRVSRRLAGQPGVRKELRGNHRGLCRIFYPVL